MNAKLIAQMLLCLSSLMLISCAAGPQYGPGGCGAPSYAHNPYHETVASGSGGIEGGYATGPAMHNGGPQLVQTGFQQVQTGEEKVSNGVQGYLVQERDSATGEKIGPPRVVRGPIGKTYNGKPTNWKPTQELSDVEFDTLLKRIGGD